MDVVCLLEKMDNACPFGCCVSASFQRFQGNEKIIKLRWSYRANKKERFYVRSIPARLIQADRGSTLIGVTLEEARRAIQTDLENRGSSDG